MGPGAQFLPRHPVSTLPNRTRTVVIQISLTNADAGMLREMLEDYLSDLRMEVAGTDSRDWREALKRREALLKRLLDELARPAA